MIKAEILNEIKDEVFKKCTYGLYVISSGDYGCVIDTFMQITSSKEEHTKALMIINKKSDTANKVKNDRYCVIQIPSVKTNLEDIKTLGYTHSSSVRPFNSINSFTIRNNDLNRDEHILLNLCGALTARVDKVYTVKDRYIFILDIDDDTNIRVMNKYKPMTYNYFKKKANKRSIFKKRSK